MEKRRVLFVEFIENSVDVDLQQPIPRLVTFANVSVVFVPNIAEAISVDTVLQFSCAKFICECVDRCMSRLCNKDSRRDGPYGVMHNMLQLLLSVRFCNLDVCKNIDIRRSFNTSYHDT